MNAQIMLLKQSVLYNKTGQKKAAEKICRRGKLFKKLL
jgi:hypothetical protein